jgi:hypothetical protein
MTSQTWTQQIQAHLELLNQLASRLPANERLEVEELNKILKLSEEFKQKFLFMCELYGFEIKKKI